MHLECSCHVKKWCGGTSLMVWCYDSVLPVQRARVPSPVGELRPHMSPGRAKKKMVWPVICCNTEVLGKISSAGQSYIKCSITLYYSCCRLFPAVTWAVWQGTCWSGGPRWAPGPDQTFPSFSLPCFSLPYGLSDSQEVCNALTLLPLAGPGQAWHLAEW